jgi:hypothetical protein
MNKVQLLALALVIAAGIFFLSKDKPSPLPPAPTAAGENAPKTTLDNEERAKWSSRIDEVGAVQAYEEYKREYANQHFGIQHTVAHIVGALLYEKLGLDGLTVCDSTFAFGCYHSFFGQALANQGTGIIRKLDELCVAKFGPLGTGCQHGIGHGLMEYYGHQRLTEALHGCAETTQVKPAFGCTSGVFMEYNVPIMITDQSAFVQVRQIDFDKPYEPCPGLESKYQQSCYYELAQWWDKDGNFDNDYTKIGLLCHNVKLKENREHCFLGTGNVSAPSSEFQVAGAIEKCLNMPEFDEQVLCRSGASWSFYSSVTYRSLAPQVCDGLPADIVRRCVLESDLIGERTQKL